MAVPKKRTSKSKKNLRKTQWKIKASFEAKKALGKAKMVLRASLWGIAGVKSSFSSCKMVISVISYQLSVISDYQ